MEINILLKNGAKMPKLAHKGDSGYDLTAVSKYYDDFGNICYGTGVHLELPEGYEAQIRPRSSISKYNLILVNSPGTIDSNYRGELIVKFKLIENNSHNKLNKEIDYNIGDRIAQMVFQKIEHFTFKENNLNGTTRGENGFGSTGE